MKQIITIHTEMLNVDILVHSKRICFVSLQ